MKHQNTYISAVMFGLEIYITSLKKSGVVTEKVANLVLPHIRVVKDKATFGIYMKENDFIDDYNELCRLLYENGLLWCLGDSDLGNL